MLLCYNIVTDGGYIMRNIDKWVRDYTMNVDISNIEWIKLNGKELGNFFEENYLDKEEWEYVLDEDANSLFPTPLGLSYLTLNDPQSELPYNFLLGIVDNNIGKKTIVSDIIYLDEYFIFGDQIEPLTYIASVEVNSYFRNRGIARKMYSAFFDVARPNQHVLTSMLSDMGKRYNLLELTKQVALEKGLKKQIFENNHNLNYTQIYELLCSKRKVLKR